MGVPEDQLRKQEEQLDAADERDRAAAAENLRRLQQTPDEGEQEQRDGGQG